jgi:hypothetical protein
MAFRKADESLVCLDKTWQFHQTCFISLQFLSLLSVNKCIVFLQLLNKGFTVIFYVFNWHYLYHWLFHLFVFQVFLSFRAMFRFTNPDYCLIEMTSLPDYSRLVMVHCSCISHLLWPQYGKTLTVKTGFTADGYHTTCLSFAAMSNICVCKKHQSVKWSFESLRIMRTENDICQDPLSWSTRNLEYVIQYIWDAHVLCRFPTLWTK